MPAALPSLARLVRSGQAKGLATNSLKRSPLALDVPALSEKIPGFDFALSIVMLAPAGTPRQVVIG